MARNSQYGTFQRPKWAGGLNCFAVEVWQRESPYAAATSHLFAMAAAVIASRAGAHRTLVACPTHLF